MCCKKGNIENFTVFFLLSFFGDFFLLHLLQNKISFLAGGVFEIFALELFACFLEKCAAKRKRVRGIVNKTIEILTIENLKIIFPSIIQAD